MWLLVLVLVLLEVLLMLEVMLVVMMLLVMLVLVVLMLMPGVWWADDGHTIVVGKPRVWLHVGGDAGLLRGELVDDDR